MIVLLLAPSFSGIVVQNAMLEFTGLAKTASKSHIEGRTHYSLRDTPYGSVLDLDQLRLVTLLHPPENIQSNITIDPELLSYATDRLRDLQSLASNVYLTFIHASAAMENRAVTDFLHSEITEKSFMMKSFQLQLSHIIIQRNHSPTVSSPAYAVVKTIAETTSAGPGGAPSFPTESPNQLVNLLETILPLSSICCGDDQRDSCFISAHNCSAGGRVPGYGINSAMVNSLIESFIGNVSSYLRENSDFILAENIQACVPIFMGKISLSELMMILPSCINGSSIILFSEVTAYMWDNTLSIMNRCTFSSSDFALSTWAISSLYFQDLMLIHVIQLSAKVLISLPALISCTLPACQDIIMMGKVLLTISSHLAPYNYRLKILMARLPAPYGETYKPILRGLLNVTLDELASLSHDVYFHPMAMLDLPSLNLTTSKVSYGNLGFLFNGSSTPSIGSYYRTPEYTFAFPYSIQLHNICEVNSITARMQNLRILSSVSVLEIFSIPSKHENDEGFYYLSNTTTSEVAPNDAESTPASTGNAATYRCPPSMFYFSELKVCQSCNEGFYCPGNDEQIPCKLTQDPLAVYYLRNVTSNAGCLFRCPTQFYPNIKLLRCVLAPPGVAIKNYTPTLCATKALAENTVTSDFVQSSPPTLLTPLNSDCNLYAMPGSTVLVSMIGGDNLTAFVSGNGTLSLTLELNFTEIRQLFRKKQLGSPTRVSDTHIYSGTEPLTMTILFVPGLFVFSTSCTGRPVPHTLRCRLVVSTATVPLGVGTNSQGLSEEAVSDWFVMSESDDDKGASSTPKKSILNVEISSRIHMEDARTGIVYCATLLGAMSTHACATLDNEVLMMQKDFAIVENFDGTETARVIAFGIPQLIGLQSNKTTVRLNATPFMTGWINSETGNYLYLNTSNLEALPASISGLSIQSGCSPSDEEPRASSYQPWDLFKLFYECNNMLAVPRLYFNDTRLIYMYGATCIPGSKWDVDLCVSESEPLPASLNMVGIPGVPRCSVGEFLLHSFSYTVRRNSTMLLTVLEVNSSNCGLRLDDILLAINTVNGSTLTPLLTLITQCLSLFNGAYIRCSDVPPYRPISSIRIFPEKPLAIEYLQISNSFRESITNASISLLQFRSDKFSSSSRTSSVPVHASTLLQARDLLFSGTILPNTSLYIQIGLSALIQVNLMQGLPLSYMSSLFIPEFKCVPCIAKSSKEQTSPSAITTGLLSCPCFSGSSSTYYLSYFNVCVANTVHDAPLVPYLQIVGASVSIYAIEELTSTGETTVGRLIVQTSCYDIAISSIVISTPGSMLPRAALLFVSTHKPTMGGTPVFGAWSSSVRTNTPLPLVSVLQNTGMGLLTRHTIFLWVVCETFTTAYVELQICNRSDDAFALPTLFASNILSMVTNAVAPQAIALSDIANLTIATSMSLLFEHGILCPAQAYKLYYPQALSFGFLSRKLLNITDYAILYTVVPFANASFESVCSFLGSPVRTFSSSVDQVLCLELNARTNWKLYSSGEAPAVIPGVTIFSFAVRRDASKLMSRITRYSYLQDQEITSIVNATIISNVTLPGLRDEDSRQTSSSCTDITPIQRYEIVLTMLSTVVVIILITFAAIKRDLLFTFPATICCLVYECFHHKKRLPRSNAYSQYLGYALAKEFSQTQDLSIILLEQDQKQLQRSPIMLWAFRYLLADSIGVVLSHPRLALPTTHEYRSLIRLIDNILFCPAPNFCTEALPFVGKKAAENLQVLSLKLQLIANLHNLRAFQNGLMLLDTSLACSTSVQQYNADPFSLIPDQHGDSRLSTDSEANMEARESGQPHFDSGMETSSIYPESHTLPQENSCLSVLAESISPSTPPSRMSLLNNRCRQRLRTPLTISSYVVSNSNDGSSSPRTPSRAPQFELPSSLVDVYLFNKYVSAVLETQPECVDKQVLRQVIAGIYRLAPVESPLFALGSSTCWKAGCAEPVTYMCCQCPGRELACHLHRCNNRYHISHSVAERSEDRCMLCSILKASVYCPRCYGGARLCSYCDMLLHIVCCRRYHVRQVLAQLGRWEKIPNTRTLVIKQ